MPTVIELPDNFISQNDRKALESFGGHEISLGRATRFQWEQNEDNETVFKLYRGGPDEKLVFSIERDRIENAFIAVNPAGKPILSGSLDHIMAKMDEKLLLEHGESMPLDAG